MKLIIMEHRLLRKLTLHSWRIMSDGDHEKLMEEISKLKFPVEIPISEEDCMYVCWDNVEEAMSNLKIYELTKKRANMLRGDFQTTNGVGFFPLEDKIKSSTA